MRYQWIIALLLLSLAWPLWANQDVEKLNEEVNELSSDQQQLFKSVSEQLRCPTCTGLSIMQSDAPFSLQIRAAVVDQLRQGKGNDAILQFFTERYGLWILREPPKEGFHIFAWLIPIGFMVLGPIALWFFVWRRRILVSTFGMRSVDVILSEMEEELKVLRTAGVKPQGGAL